MNIPAIYGPSVYYSGDSSCDEHTESTNFINGASVNHFGNCLHDESHIQ